MYCTLLGMFQHFVRKHYSEPWYVSDQNNDLRKIMNFIVCLPSCLSCSIFNVWIVWRDIAHLDCALCEKKSRPAFLCLLSSAECVVETQINHSNSRFLQWLLSRQIKLQCFLIFEHTEEELEAQYVRKYGSFISTIVRTPSKTAPQHRVETIKMCFSIRQPNLRAVQSSIGVIIESHPNLLSTLANA